jgi:methionyl-tRNA formyltransferase
VPAKPGRATPSRCTFDLTDLAPLPAGPARSIAYLGTPDVAVAPLRSLVDAGVHVALVVTGPDKRRGRGSETSPSPVKAAALELGLRVEHDLRAVTDSGVDLAVVVAYGRLIPVDVLRVVPMVNVHFSLLPRWRGAAPVERALLAGDTETGVCIMRVVEGLDEGEVYDTVTIPIRTDHTLTSLRDELVAASTAPLVRLVTAGAPHGREQSGEVVYARKIRPEELRLQWTDPAERVWATTRLESAWFTFGDRRVRVVQARVANATYAASNDVAQRPGSVLRIDRSGVVVACGSGAVVLERVRPEGKRDMAAHEWAQGARLVAAGSTGSSDATITHLT